MYRKVWGSEDFIGFCEIMWGKLIAPWSRVLVEKRTFCPLVRKFSTFCGIRRFYNRVFGNLPPTLIPSQVRRRVSPPKSCVHLSSPIYAQHAICPAHLIVPDLITWMLCGETYRSHYVIRGYNSKPNNSAYLNETEYRQMHNFNGAFVDCSYLFRLLQTNHFQAVYQRCKKEIILYADSGRFVGLTGLLHI